LRGKKIKKEFIRKEVDFPVAHVAHGAFFEREFESVILPAIETHEEIYVVTFLFCCAEF
jgi:hypothetical protein